MNTKIFYGKLTIILFIVLLIIFLAIPYYQYKTAMIEGGNSVGWPFTYSSWGTTTPEMAVAGTQFSVLPFIGNIIVFYLAALIISLIISAFIKK